jgi:predicted MPP superfamily phosphohydrolase
MKKIGLLKAVAVLISLFFLFIVYSYFETYWYDVNRVVIVDSVIPSGFDNKTVVFISDLHYGSFFGADRVRYVVGLVNSLEPDYIVLGGDYVSADDDWNYGTAKLLFDELKRLNSVPKYGVLGNHDHWFNRVAVADGLRYADIMLIDNVCVNLSEGIRLCGVGDLWEDTQFVEEDVANYTVIVSHNPDYAEELIGEDFDLVLSGHNHGGQVTFFGLWAPYLVSDYGQKYRSGLVDNGFVKVYVTRGAGQGLPLRFFARPEITVLTLKKG